MNLSAVPDFELGRKLLGSAPLPRRQLAYGAPRRDNSYEPMLPLATSEGLEPRVNVWR